MSAGTEDWQGNISSCRRHTSLLLLQTYAFHFHLKKFEFTTQENVELHFKNVEIVVIAMEGTYGKSCDYIGSKVNIYWNIF